MFPEKINGKAGAETVMIKLSLMLAAVTVLAGLSRLYYARIYVSDPCVPAQEQRRDFFYILILVILIAFAGLRTKYNDTEVYIQNYEDLGDRDIGEYFSDPDSWKPGKNPGFVSFNIVLYRLTDGNPHIFIFVWTAFTLTVFLGFIRRYSDDFVLSLFVFIALGQFCFIMAAMKQVAATAFGLLAIQKLLDNKKAAYIILLLAGASIHPYVLVYFLAPLMKSKPWRKWTYLIIAAAVLIILTFNSALRNIIAVTSFLGDSYTEKTFSYAGVNAVRVAVYLVPAFLAFALPRSVYEGSSDSENLMVNMTVICSSIMVIALFGTANYFTRMAFYFAPFMVVSMAYTLNRFERGTSCFLKTLCYYCFAVFFFYSYAFNEAFSADYKTISVREFIGGLFGG